MKKKWNPNKKNLNSIMITGPYYTFLYGKMINKLLYLKKKYYLYLNNY